MIPSEDVGTAESGGLGTDVVRCPAASWLLGLHPHGSALERAGERALGWASITANDSLSGYSDVEYDPCSFVTSDSTRIPQVSPSARRKMEILPVHPPSHLSLLHPTPASIHPTLIQHLLSRRCSKSQRFRGEHHSPCSHEVYIPATEGDNQ